MWEYFQVDVQIYPYIFLGMSVSLYGKGRYSRFLHLRCRNLHIFICIRVDFCGEFLIFIYRCQYLLMSKNAHMYTWLGDICIYLHVYEINISKRISSLRWRIVRIFKIPISTFPFVQYTRRQARVQVYKLVSRPTRSPHMFCDEFCPYFHISVRHMQLCIYDHLLCIYMLTSLLNQAIVYSHVDTSMYASRYDNTGNVTASHISTWPDYPDVCIIVSHLDR